MTYKEKLLDPRWQKKRLEILNRDEFTCQICKSKDNTLHIHHRRYIVDRDPWDYPEESLVTLCADCHELEKGEMDEYLPMLIEQMKDKFFADDFREIAWGIHNVEIIKSTHHTARLISEILKNSNLMKQLNESIFPQTVVKTINE